jgi:hypothetical protein
MNEVSFALLRLTGIIDEDINILADALTNKAYNYLGSLLLVHSSLTLKDNCTRNDAFLSLFMSYYNRVLGWLICYSLHLSWLFTLSV